MPLIAPTDIAIVSTLLDDALELPAAEREAWLAALPPEHQRHAPALRAMLAERDATSGEAFLASGPWLGGDDAVAHAGERVGPYRLLREIGLGGMGSVWLAERADGSFQRQVALKLPRLAWGAGLAERMARERDIGARLEHPAIARLYDAGVDERGRPYLALEFIDGQPIDTWCEAQGLDVRDRLRLFVQVVKAVAYAHGRLVVHRDLKPSNVLVTPDGQAHLLDFGIAKLLQDEASPSLTQEQGRVLTPQYASPEQVAGEPVTVQSDVYSLGVLLYELLTGTLPHQARRNTLGAMEQAILEGNAPPASSRMKNKAAARALRGEIDAILGKAMCREATRRYATADAMAQDIERHLSGETVTARPDSVSYRLGKAVRRHRMGVAATTAVLLAVLSAAGVAVVQAQRAAQSAERERVVRGFVADVFRVGVRLDPKDTARRPASTPSLIEGGAQLIEQRFAGQPELQAELFGVVSGLFSEMGAYALAVEYAERRIAAMERLGTQRRELSSGTLALAQALFDQRRHDDAEGKATHAQRLAGGDRAIQVELLVLLARIHAEQQRLDRYEATLGKLEAALDVDEGRRLFPMASAWSTALRARLLSLRNHFDEAKPLFERAIAEAIAAGGERSNGAITIRRMYALRLVLSPEYEQAAAHHAAAMDALRALGPFHTVRAIVAEAQFANVAYMQFAHGTARQAIETLRAKLTELGQATVPIPPAMTARIRFMIGQIQCDAGEIEEGWVELQATEAQVRSTAATLADLSWVTASVALCAQAAGQHQIADRMSRAVLELRVRRGMGGHPYAADDYRAVAENLMMAGDTDTARAVLDSAPDFPDMRGEGMKPDRYARWLDLTRAKVTLGAGRSSEAMEWLQRSRYDDVDPDDRRFFDGVAGEVLCAIGRRREGRNLLHRHIQAESQVDGSPHRPWLARARAVAGDCALAAGDHRSAQRYAHEARAAFTAQSGVSPYFKAPLFKLERALGLKLPAV